MLKLVKKDEKCIPKISTCTTYFDNDRLISSTLGIFESNFFFLCSDHFNRLHESIRNNGNTNKEPYHQNDIQDTTTKSFSTRKNIIRLPNWNNQTITTVDTLWNTSYFSNFFNFSIVIILRRKRLKVFNPRPRVELSHFISNT